MRLFKLLIFVLLFSNIACKKSTTSPKNFYVALNATMNGTNQVPINSSAATGSATAVYNTKSRILTLNITYTNTTPTTAHIHKGAAGITGPIIFTFSVVTSPINFTTEPLDATQETDLLANLYYVDIHSAAYPGGEIRGQFITQ